MNLRKQSKAAIKLKVNGNEKILAQQYLWLCLTDTFENLDLKSSWCAQSALLFKWGSIQMLQPNQGHLTQKYLLFLKLGFFKKTKPKQIRSGK